MAEAETTNKEDLGASAATQTDEGPVERTVADSGPDSDAAANSNETLAGPVAPSAADAEDGAVEDSTELPAGEVLKRARLAQGLSIADVAGALRLSATDLSALERMEVGKWVPVYLSGRVRSYAAHLGLDAGDLLARYKAETSAFAAENKKADGPSTSFAAASSALNARASRPIALFAFAAAAAFTGLWFVAAGPGGLAADSAQDQAAVAAHGPFASVRADLALKALRPAPVEIRGADGTIFLSRTLHGGELYHPRTGAGWSVTTPDAGAFVWEMPGSATPVSLGEAGQTLIAADIDSAKARLLAELPEAPGLPVLASARAAAEATAERERDAARDERRRADGAARIAQTTVSRLPEPTLNGTPLSELPADPGTPGPSQTEQAPEILPEPLPGVTYPADA